MDVSSFNSSVEDQMVMEAMMMQMEKFLDVPSEAPPPASMMEIPLGVPLPPFLDTPPVTSLTSITPSSGVTLSRTVVADPASASSIHANSTEASSKGAADDRRLRHRQTPMEVMREMVFRIAAMQPIHIDPESVKPPKRRNVRISKDPQSVAARHRRERISERIRILQRLVPGGTKMDTASMLDEAIHYVKFLKTQVQSLELVAASSRNTGLGLGFGLSPAAAVPGEGFSCSLGRVCVPLQQQSSANHTWTMS